MSVNEISLKVHSCQEPFSKGDKVYYPIWVYDSSGKYTFTLYSTEKYSAGQLIDCKVTSFKGKYKLQVINK